MAGIKQVYLDNNATTRVHPEVVKAMVPYFDTVFGNASSIHQYGQAARAAVEEARQQAARLIGAEPEEVFFTSGGTESDNLALKGAVEAAGKTGLHIITSAVEHHAVLNTCQYLEKQGAAVTYLPVDNYGCVDPDDVKKAIRKKTVLVSIMAANNEVGTIEPIAQIGEITRGRGVLFHTDAVQALGKIPINAGELKADMMSFSGHKIYGPKGVGVIYIRRGTRIIKQMHGGHHEGSRRAGTENVPGIVGFGHAAHLAGQHMDAENRTLRALRDRLWQGIKDGLDDVRLNGHPEHRLPNTLNVSFGYVEGEAIVLNYDLKGIAVSSGSACTSGTPEPSHVLKAMGIDPIFAQGSIRFSLGRETTQAEIDQVVDCTPGIIEKLRRMSPLYRKKDKANA